MGQLHSGAEIEILASAIARRLASPVRTTSPVASASIESVASAVARRLASPSRVASPGGVNIESVASAIAHQLASPVQYAPQALASAVASRVASSARSAVAGKVSHSEIDVDAVASQVAGRLASPQGGAASPQKTVENLASAIAGRLQQSSITLPAGEFERLASRVASTISRRLAPAAASSGPLPSADKVDASQALKAEDQKAKKGDKRGEG